MMRRAIGAMELRGAVSVWDHHVVSCPVCLANGLNLCPEGQYLTEDVIAVRSALEHRMAKLDVGRGVMPAIGIEA
jgi:hypothetical protein